MKDRLRIAVLSRNFSATGGGAERYSVAVARQLSQHFEVHVFAQFFDAGFPGIEYHRLPCPIARPRWINQLYFAWASWWATRKGFDVVLSHENTWHGDIQVVHVQPIKHNLFVGRTGFQRALRLLKVCSSVRLLAYLWLESARYRATPGRHVVLTSGALRNAMLVSYPHTGSMLKVIAPAVEIVNGPFTPELRVAARKRLGLPQQVPLLLFVANDMRKKGLPTLLAALEHLPGVNLAVVGSGDHLDAMRLASDKALKERVHFLGKLDDVADAYQAAVCLVHPTLEDTYAMVVLEAMAYGLPVVVSSERYCGIAAELRSETDALVLEKPQDSDALAVAIHRLLTSPELAAKLSSNGLAFARSRTWGAVGQAYAQLMRARIKSA